MPNWLKGCLWIAAFVAVLTIWWYGGHYPLRVYSDAKPEDVINPGTFGDSFGFINSLFSSLGFTIAMVALAVQASQSRKANEIANRTALLTNHKIKADTIIGMMKTLDQIQTDLLILKSKQDLLVRKNSEEHIKAQRALTADIRLKFAQVTTIQTEMMLMFYQSGYETRETLLRWKDFLTSLDKQGNMGSLKFHQMAAGQLESELQSLMSRTSDATFALAEVIARELEVAFPVNSQGSK